MLLALPLVAIALGSLSSSLDQPASEHVTVPRVAQVRLAELLAAADSVDAMHAVPQGVAIELTRGGDALRVRARVDARGAVTALTVTPLAGPPPMRGALGWLSTELADTAAVTRLVVDDDGSILVVTSTARRYLVLPGRGSGGASGDRRDGNAAIRARWAAAWSVDEA